MADIRESFPSLESSTGAGEALRAMQQGDSPNLKNGALSFAFRDSAGLVTLPMLQPDGTLAVSVGAPGTAKLQRGLHAGSTVIVDVATLALTVNKVYTEISFTASCFKETTFQLVQKDAAAEIILDDIVVGPGAYIHTIDLKDYLFTAGATGTQSLIVRGTNLNVATTMRARVSATEVA